MLCDAIKQPRYFNLPESDCFDTLDIYRCQWFHQHMATFENNCGGAASSKDHPQTISEKKTS